MLDVNKALYERDKKLYRHTIEREHKRYKFITEYNILCKRMLQCLLHYSNTGNEQNIADFTKLYSYDFNKMWISFIEQEGFFDD